MTSCTRRSGSGRPGRGDRRRRPLRGQPGPRPAFDGHGEAGDSARRADPAGLRQRDPQRAETTPAGSSVEVAGRGGRGRLYAAGGRPQARVARPTTAIFEPFHRSGGSHTTGGFGLGLAIARAGRWGGHGGRIRPATARTAGCASRSFCPFAAAPPWIGPGAAAVRMRRGGLPRAARWVWSGRKARTVPCWCRGRARHPHSEMGVHRDARFCRRLPGRRPGFRLSLINSAMAYRSRPQVAPAQFRDPRPGGSTWSVR